MASPATNKRIPDTKISAGSRETCSANAGNEPMFSSMLAAIMTRVGPIRPAIVFEVFIRLASGPGISISCYPRQLRSADLPQASRRFLDKVVRESAGGALGGPVAREY